METNEYLQVQLVKIANACLAGNDPSVEGVLRASAEMIEQQQVEIERLTARNMLLDAANGGDRALLEDMYERVKITERRVFRLVCR